MRRLIRALGRLAGGFLLAIFALWAVSMAAVLIFSYIDQAKPAESIVVLGAAQYDGRPSPVLRARLDHGIDLWNRGMGKVLVLTGGRGAGDTTSEAEAGRAYARKHGVPDTVILLENKGRTTRESMLGVAQLLQDRGIKTAILGLAELIRPSSFVSTAVSVIASFTNYFLPVVLIEPENSTPTIDE